MWLPKPQFFGSNIAKFSVERIFFSWPNTRTRPRALGQVPEPAREKFEIPVPARNPKIQKKGYPNPLDTRKIPTRHITSRCQNLKKSTYISLLLFLIVSYE